MWTIGVNFVHTGDIMMVQNVRTVMEQEQQVVDHVVAELTHSFPVQRIVLFGSRARGEADEDSDYDVAEGKVLYEAANSGVDGQSPDRPRFGQGRIHRSGLGGTSCIVDFNRGNAPGTNCILLQNAGLNFRR